MSVLGFIYQWQNYSYIYDIYVIPIKFLILKIYFIYPTPFFFYKTETRGTFFRGIVCVHVSRKSSISPLLPHPLAGICLVARLIG